METLHTIQPIAQVGGALWLKWVLANAITLAISVAPTFIAPVVSEAPGATMDRNTVTTIVSVLTLLSGILIAILVGMLQWLVLRRHIRWANQWGLATSVGWIVGGFLAPYAALALLVVRPPALSFSAVTTTLNAAVVGIFQWFVLHRWVRRAGWWMLASIAGWVIGEWLGLYAGYYVALFTGGIVVGLSRNLISLVFSASEQATIGAIAGSITGIVLVWLLRHSRREAL